MILNVLKELLKTGESRFASFVYTNKEGETSHYLVHLNVNYRKILQRDLKVLLKYRPADELQEQARAEIERSITETLVTGRNSAYTKEGYYESLSPAVKFHEDELYVYGFVVRKTVLVPTVYKEVKSKPLTIAKNMIRKLLKASKFREFKLDMKNLHTVKANGKVLELA